MVLRVWPLGEGDLILSVLSPTLGKLSVVAKGARKPKSRFAGAAQPFSHLRFSAYRGRSLDILSQGELVSSFRGIHDDLVKLAAATYLAELTGAVVQEKEPAPLPYSLLLAVLHILAGPVASVAAVVRAFEVRFLAAVGFRLELAGCVVCRRPLTPEATSVRLSPELGGVVCRHCLGQARSVVGLPRASFDALAQLATLDLRRLEVLTLAPEVAADVGRATEAFVRFRVEKELKSLAFYKSLET